MIIGKPGADASNGDGKGWEIAKARADRTRGRSPWGQLFPKCDPRHTSSMGC